MDFEQRMMEIYGNLTSIDEKSQRRRDFVKKSSKGKRG